MKTIIDVIQTIQPSTVIKTVSGIEFNQRVDFRPRMLKAAAHAALTSAIWEAQADIRRAEYARREMERPISGEEQLRLSTESHHLTGMAAQLYCAIRADMAEISGLAPFDHPMSPGDMYDFLTPKENQESDSTAIPELLKQLDSAQRRRMFLDNRTEVLAVIEAAASKEDVLEIELPLQLKMADRACRAVLKDAERYVRNAATKGNKAVSSSLENQLLARKAVKELLDEVQSLVREHMEELSARMERGYMPPDLDFSQYIEEAEAESIKAIKEQIAQLR